MDMSDVEILYDNLIGKIFGQGSTRNLLFSQAYYDGSSWESVLYNMCGNELLIDSNRYNVPRVFCVSSNVSCLPQATQLWTNYNCYPGPDLGDNSPDAGASFRVNTAKAVRATSAAPSLFTHIVLDGFFYADGALVANNPIDLAMDEAKRLYKDESVELVVSIGTGIYKQAVTSYNLAVTTQNLLYSGTDTEKAHKQMLRVSADTTYLRLNPTLNGSFSIDSKDPESLAFFKRRGKEHVDLYFEQKPQELPKLIKILNGLNP
jgi:predicted acylesterase/phospholipase RssA